MNSSNGFVDLLFILLLATLGMLCDSTRLGAIAGSPAEAGGGGVSLIQADQVKTLVVDADHLVFEAQAYPNAAALPEAAAPSARGGLLIVPAHEQTPHQAVVTVWSDLADRGWRASLGVRIRGANP